MHGQPLTLIEITLILLFGATLMVAIAHRFRLPFEVLLVIASAGLSFIPGLPRLELDPHYVFLVFLPPILFGAAYFTSWRDFKANLRPIGLLAIGLVLFNTLAVGAVLHWLMPRLPLAVAFLFGAIIAPPDASAATAITRKLGVPRRLLTVIEGESLVNDSTALIAYRFAVAAIATGGFSAPQAVGQFFWLATAGTITGLVVAWIGAQALKRLPDTHAQVAMSFLTAFGCYAVAERLGVSGVLAAVAGGLYFGRVIPAMQSPQLRVDALAAWNFVLFIINGLAFALIGLQLPSVIAGLRENYWLAELNLIAVLICAVVIAVRFIWVFPATMLPRWIIPGLAKRDPMPPMGVITILAWTGMRGIVSLAAALALPETLPNGSPFPHRDLLIFLTYWVVLVTLVAPSLTLPGLMRWFKIRPGQENEREEALARAEITQGALSQLKGWVEQSNFAQRSLTPTLGRYERRLETLQSNVRPEAAFSPLFDEDQERRRLDAEVLKVERDALHGLRRGGKIHDEVFHLISRELDLEELRLRTGRA